VKRDFLVAAYHPNKEGKIIGEKPKKCPEGMDGSECRICVQFYRVRKTGPKFSLMVVRCKTHGGCYTVYPVGYTPYGRAPVVPVDDLGQATREKKTQGDGYDIWMTTIFAAAVAAGVYGEVWAYNGKGQPGWHTQKRQIGQVVRWLGLDRGLLDAQIVAQALNVGVTIHGMASRQLLKASTLTAKAKAVIMVLDKFPKGWMGLKCLLRAGRCVGMCGRGWMWKEGKLRSF
jgi:hypothetical protein